MSMAVPVRASASTAALVPLLPPSRKVDGSQHYMIGSIKSSRAPFTPKLHPAAGQHLLLFFNSHVDGVRDPYFL